MPICVQLAYPCSSCLSVLTVPTGEMYRGNVAKWKPLDSRYFEAVMPPSWTVQPMCGEQVLRTRRPFPMHALARDQQDAHPDRRRRRNNRGGAAIQSSPDLQGVRTDGEERAGGKGEAPLEGKRLVSRHRDGRKGKPQRHRGKERASQLLYWRPDLCREAWSDYLRAHEQYRGTLSDGIHAEESTDATPYGRSHAHIHRLAIHEKHDDRTMDAQTQAPEQRPNIELEAPVETHFQHFQLA